MSATLAINNFCKNIVSYFKISHSYFRRRNPIIAYAISFLTTIYNMVNLKTRLRALKYQVQVQYYRMQQMEKLMNEGNPHNLQGGFHINKLR